MGMARVALLVVLVAFVAVGCGGNNNSPSTTGSNGTTTANGTLRATISGSSWTALIVSSTYTPAQALVPAIVTIGGSGTKWSLDIGISTATSGTYALGVNALNIAISDNSAHRWHAVSGTAGSSGTITFTTLTATHAVGTFSCVAPPEAGTGATGTLTVTSGTFDVPLTQIP